MTLDNRALKTIFVTNIVALAGAIVALIWNAATLTARFEAVEKELVRVNAVQTSVIVEQEGIKSRLLADEQAQILLDGRIFRLEDLSLRRGR